MSDEAINYVLSVRDNILANLQVNGLAETVNADEELPGFATALAMPPQHELAVLATKFLPLGYRTPDKLHGEGDAEFRTRELAMAAVALIEEVGRRLAAQKVVEPVIREGYLFIADNNGVPLTRPYPIRAELLDGKWHALDDELELELLETAAPGWRLIVGGECRGELEVPHKGDGHGPCWSASSLFRGDTFRLPLRHKTWEDRSYG